MSKDNKKINAWKTEDAACYYRVRCTSAKKAGMVIQGGKELKTNSTIALSHIQNTDIDQKLLHEKEKRKQLN